jgi:hypothetical protein
MGINGDAASSYRDRTTQLRVQALVDILESLTPEAMAELVATLALDGLALREGITDTPADLATLVLDGLVVRSHEH